MVTKSPKVFIESLVELFRVHAALVAAEMASEQTGDHRSTIRAQKLPRGILLDKLGKFENTSNGGHAYILVHVTDK